MHFSVYVLFAAHPLPVNILTTTERVEKLDIRTCLGK